MSDETTTPKTTEIKKDEIAVVMSATETAGAQPAAAKPNGALAPMTAAEVPAGAQVLDLRDPDVAKAVAEVLESTGHKAAADKVRGKAQEMKFLQKMGKVGDKNIKLRHVAYFAGGALVIFLGYELVGRWTDIPCIGIFKKKAAASKK